MFSYLPGSRNLFFLLILIAHSCYIYTIKTCGGYRFHCESCNIVASIKTDSLSRKRKELDSERIIVVAIWRLIVIVQLRFGMKLLRIWVVLLVLSYCSLHVQAQSPSPPRDDRQIWTETQIIKPLTDDKDLIIIGVLRFGREFRRPVDERIGGGVAFKLNKYLTLMPTYLYVDQQPYEGSRISEHRLIINLTGKIGVGKLTFTNRNLVERRVRHKSRDFTMYRNRLQIDHPARLGRFQFKPFLADEIFYSTQTGTSSRQGWFRNRISAGIIRQINKRLNAEFFYLYQHDGISRPGNIHAIGTVLRIYLD
jgi:hypothetical protein